MRASASRLGAGLVVALVVSAAAVAAAPVSSRTAVHFDMILPAVARLASGPAGISESESNAKVGELAARDGRRRLSARFQRKTPTHSNAAA